MIESLFGYNLQNSMKNEETKSKSPSPSKHVLDPKRLQNITILSKALNVTAEQACEALIQGNTVIVLLNCPHLLKERGVFFLYNVYAPKSNFQSASVNNGCHTNNKMIFVPCCAKNNYKVIYTLELFNKSSMI